MFAAFASIPNFLGNTKFLAYPSLISTVSPFFPRDLTKWLAFTLAEVLITLAIIGVVSVLTLPNVMTNYKTRVFTTQIQRFYNQWNNAATQYMQDQNVDKFDETGIMTTPQDFFKKYFKVTKVCGNDANGCFGKEYFTITDKSNAVTVTEIVNNEYKPYCVTLNTGASVCYLIEMPDVVIFDANGVDLPNVAGRDYFLITQDFRGDGTLGKYIVEPETRADKDGNTYQVSGSEILEEAKKYCTEPRSIDIKRFGFDCFKYIQANSWKMDY